MSKSIYILNWYAYAEVSTDLDGGFVAAFHDFEEAKAEMQRNIERNLVEYPSAEVTEDEFSMTMTSKNDGYSVTFYITKIDEESFHA